MRCHFAYDKVSKEKVFIPYCYTSLHSGDKEDCTCEFKMTLPRYEKAEFNAEVLRLQDIIKCLEGENKDLNLFIEELTKP